MSNLYQDREVKVVLLHVGVNIDHKVSTSLEKDRTGVEMRITPIGIHVLHLKTHREYIVPYSNIHNFEMLPEEKRKRKTPIESVRPNIEAVELSPGEPS